MASIEDAKGLFEVESRIIKPQTRVQSCSLSQLVIGHREVVHFQVLLQSCDIVGLWNDGDTTVKVISVSCELDSMHIYDHIPLSCPAQKDLTRRPTVLLRQLLNDRIFE